MMGRLLTFLARCLLSLRYRVRIEGLEAVLAKGRKGVLLLPNHPAYVDPMILLTHFYPGFRPHILADKDNMAKPMARWLAQHMGVRPIPDPAVHGEASLPEVERVIQACAEELRQGENYLLYPAGRIYTSRFESLGANSGVETILSKAPEVRILLIRTTGLWGSSFSKAAHPRPDWQKCILGGFRSLLANFLFFGPRREVTIRIQEAEDFPRTQGRLAQNRYLEDFYNQEAPPARYVPYTIWEGGSVREMPEPSIQKIEGNLDEVPASVREQMRGKLIELTGMSSFPDSALLAKDLGLDSLARVELQLWIEREFGHEIPDPDALQTVGDCLLAACGQASGKARAELPKPKAQWFQPRLPLDLPEGDRLTDCFLRQAARDPERLVAADLTGGLKSYRDLLTAILVLKPRIEAMEGEKVGIMLPASTAVAVAYFAVLFAGKVPVMINWTAGARNISHGLNLLGVRKVITSSQLVTKVESMGTDLSSLKDHFWVLEDLRQSLKTLEKLKAFLQAKFSWRSLREAKVPEPAVILFTSGSEALPKAVPLTHANLLANLRDLASLFPLESTDKIIGFLPPFHSFGLTGTLLFPLCLGLPVVYSPNPTDGAALARMVEAYGVTMLVGTPTFLAGIVRSASDAQLASLRLAMTGAEKCPDSLFEALKRRVPALRVMEGYGITECSPVISVNPYENPRPGSIGKPLPSVRHLLLDLESEKPVEPGGTGMLLVRGPSIFGGYLHFEGASPFADHDGYTWYRTGDLVREDPDGYWIFAGRLKRFVKLGGEMVSLPAVEEVLLKHFTREDDQEIPLAVEATPTEGQPELVLFSIRPISREEANGVLGRSGLSPLHFIRQVREVEKIPLLGTGKTDYRALKAMLA